MNAYRGTYDPSDEESCARASRFRTEPTFSNPDKSPVAVTPGVTELERAAARRVHFNQPPDRTGPEWYDENDERL